MDEFDFFKNRDEYGILITGKKVVNRLIIQHLKHIEFYRNKARPANFLTLEPTIFVYNTA